MLGCQELFYAHGKGHWQGSVQLGGKSKGLGKGRQSSWQAMAREIARGTGQTPQNLWQAQA
eukprot:4529574-Alexandrium_andersonii.AAC.1